MSGQYNLQTGMWSTPFSWAPVTPDTSQQAPNPGVADPVGGIDFSGQNSGGKDHGYNAVSPSFGDWGKSLAFGGLSLLGGPLSAMVNVGLTAINGKPTTPTTLAYSTLKDLLGKSVPTLAMPSLDPALADNLSGGMANIGGSAINNGFGLGDLSGLSQNGLNGIADITGGGNSMSGGTGVNGVEVQGANSSGGPGNGPSGRDQ